MRAESGPSVVSDEVLLEKGVGIGRHRPTTGEINETLAAIHLHSPRRM